MLKDDRGTGALATGKDYEALLRESRKRQLRLTVDNVQRLEATFQAAIEKIIAKIEALPEERIGTAWHRAQLRLMADIRNTMDALKRDYGTLLDIGMTELAQAAATREAKTADLVGAKPDPALAAEFERSITVGTLEVQVQFGRLALQSVERAANRYYTDGLKLSDRLYKLDTGARQAIENTIVQGLTEQISAREMAKRLRGNLLAAGSANPRYDAMRIARTEIRTAHAEASILATQKPGGGFKDYISGVRWCLSASHPQADICDLYAGWDGGMGPGVYEANDVPGSHPHCLCFLTDVLVAFPDSGIGRKPASAEDVPEYQRRQWEAQRAAR